MSLPQKDNPTRRPFMRPPDVQMAGLTAVDTTMGEMVVPPGGLQPGSLCVDNISFPMNPGPTVADQGLRSYNPMSFQSSTMAPQQLPYSTASIACGVNAYGSPCDGRDLADFTKQSNWIQQVIGELKDFLYILAFDGKLLYVSPSCKTLTGHESNHLVGNSILDFVHTDDKTMFLREFNESIATGQSARFHYRFKKLDGAYLILEVQGQPHSMPETMASDAVNGQVTPRVFLMMSRPYPSESARLLDSFLEHKLEHERLMRKIVDLKREEEEESDAHQQWVQKQDSTQNPTPDHAASRNDNFKIHADVSSEFGTPLPPTAGRGSAIGPREGAVTNFLLNCGLMEKVSRFDNSAYLDGIEVMTGLRYREGERSHGISTGDPSAALIQSNTSVTLPSEREYRTGGNGDKKKKQKATEEYVCTDCGTLASPEWRKGPKGPKTLCNACGLRWAKKEKRRLESLPTHHTPVTLMGVAKVQDQKSKVQL